MLVSGCSGFVAACSDLSPAASWYTNHTGFNYSVVVPSISQNTWHHAAMVHHGGTLVFYLDGVGYGSSTMGITDEDQTALTIGCTSWNNLGNYFTGYIDELRITNGVARYLGNFTPPTASFPSAP